MSNKKILLLAGGGYADIPLIKAAQELGYFVVTTGNRPEELGHKQSDKYHAADYSDPDAMLSLARELAIDAICPSCNDFSAISCAYVAERLDLPGFDSYETNKLIHHKDSFREFAQQNSIPSPKAKGFADPQLALNSLSEFQFPVIIKPVDLTGGKGITKVNIVSDAKSAIEKAYAISKAGRIVVEEFIAGSRHGFSAFILDGKVVFHFTDNEHYYLNQYLVSGASTPSMVSTAAVQKLIAHAERISRLLALSTGIFHVQFIMRNDEPIIIEICRRPPGDLYILLVKLATGVDYPSWLVKASCGLDCSGLKQVDVDGYYLRHCIMASRPGILDGIEIDSGIKDNIIDSMVWWKAGEIVDDFLVKKFGIVFMKFDSMSELLTRSNEMQGLIRARVRQI